jgi:hypothetical protein
MRNHWIRAALAAAAVAVVLTVTGCSSASSSSSASSPPSTARAVASSAPAPQPSSALTQSSMAAWCDSQAFRDNESAVAAASQVSQDEKDNNLGSEPGDGATLEGVASQVGSDELPPMSKVHKVNYGLYFVWLTTVGQDVAAGDIKDADTAAAKADQFRSAVQYVDDQCTELGD